MSQPAPIPQPQLLQGNVTKRGLPPVFAEAVISIDPDGWNALPVKDKSDVALDFWQRHYEQNEDFKSLTPVEQSEVKVDFFKRNAYGVYTEPKQTQTGEFFDVLPGLASGAAETGSYITQPIERLMGTGIDRHEATRHAAYKNNPYYRFGADVGRFGSLAAGTILGTVGAAAAGVPSALAGIVGAGGLSLNENIQRALGGQQNIGQSAFNVLLDAGTAGIANRAKTVLGAAGLDAAIGGAGAGAGYLGNTALTGQQFAPHALLEALKVGAITGGAIGGGVKAAQGAPFARQKAIAPQRPSFKSKNVNLAIEQGQQMADARALRATISKRQQEIMDAQAVTEQKTYQDRLNNLNKLYKGLDQIERSNQPVVSKRAAEMKAQIQAEYTKVLAEKEAKYPSQKPQKPGKSVKPGQLPSIVNLGVKAVKQGGAARKQFKDVVKGYNKQDQTKINRAIQNKLDAERQAAQTEKDRKAVRKELYREKKAEQNAQLIKDASVEADEIVKAYEPPKPQDGSEILSSIKEGVEEGIEDVKPKFKGEKREEYTAPGPDEYKRMAQEAKLQPKPKAEPKPKEPKTGPQSKKSILAQAMAAKRRGAVLRLEYEAEGGRSGVGGERASSTYRFKRDVVLDVTQNKNGDIILKTINENGQKTTRHLHEPESGSRIYTAKATDTPAKYALRGEDVVDLETGEIIPQANEAGTFSSAIRENIENLDRTLRKYREKKAKVGDILKASRDVDDSHIEGQLKEKNPDITEDISGDPC